MEVHDFFFQVVNLAANILLVHLITVNNLSKEDTLIMIGIFLDNPLESSLHLRHETGLFFEASLRLRVADLVEGLADNCNEEI